MKKHIFPVCYAALLTAFTVYLALDTFVISKSVQQQASQENTAMFSEIETEDTDTASQTAESSDSPSEPSGSGFDGRGHHSRPPHFPGADFSDDTVQIPAQQSDENSSAEQSGTAETVSETQNSYSDENMTVTLTQYREYDTDIYVADIQLKSAQYLKTAFANDTYGKNVTAATSEIAAAHDAVLAINGDYYGVQESGYVIRNGIVYRDRSNGKDLFCIFADGTAKIINSDDYTAEELVDMGCWQVLCFGPALLENGQITVSEGEEVGHAMASNPRTAIGIIGENHYVCVVSDGRTNESSGLSLSQLAAFMQKLGVQTAYNLDGGGSSTMYFQGQVVNSPTTNGRIKERGVSDIVYFGS